MSTLIITRTCAPRWLVACYRRNGTVRYYTPVTRRAPKASAYRFDDPFDASRVAEALNDPVACGHDPETADPGKWGGWFVVEEGMAM